VKRQDGMEEMYDPSSHLPAMTFSEVAIRFASMDYETLMKIKAAYEKSGLRCEKLERIFRYIGSLPHPGLRPSKG